MLVEDRDFDVVVVGCGCAGAIAAFVAAKKGKSVLVVERGEYAGAKNMTGGRLYAHSLRSVLEEYGAGEVDWDDIPFECKIVHERIALMDKASACTVDFSSEELGRETCDSYSVLRAPFDQWLSQLAEQAGCEVLCGMAVDELLRNDDGAIYGIRVGEDRITAHVVIVAEGANSLLTERCLGAPRPRPHQMAVGIKECFELPARVIEDRFLCQPGEGAAMLFAGDCTHGYVGGGFMYTNKESISLGLVATIGHLQEADTTICQMLDDFKKHPAVAPMISGATLVEHSGHMVSEGGYDMVPRFVYDGCLVAGDAAMLCMNLGYQVRGMDFAIASGRLAAEAACEAIDAGDVSCSALSAYKEAMESSFVIKDLKAYRSWPQVMDGWSGMFNEYPSMATAALNKLFTVDGSPSVPLKKRLKPIVKQYGIVKLARELKRAVDAL